VSLIELLDELDALEAKATPGELEQGAEPGYPMPEILRNLVRYPLQGHDRRQFSGKDFFQVRSEEDAKLLVALRNNWPRISKALREAHEVLGNTGLAHDIDRRMWLEKHGTDFVG